MPSWPDFHPERAENRHPHYDWHKWLVLLRPCSLEPWGYRRCSWASAQISSLGTPTLHMLSGSSQLAPVTFSGDLPLAFGSHHTLERHGRRSLPPEAAKTELIQWSNLYSRGTSTPMEQAEPGRYLRPPFPVHSCFPHAPLTINHMLQTPVSGSASQEPNLRRGQTMNIQRKRAFTWVSLASSYSHPGTKFSHCHLHMQAACQS